MDTGNDRATARSGPNLGFVTPAITPDSAGEPSPSFESIETRLEGRLPGTSRSPCTHNAFDRTTTSPSNVPASIHAPAVANASQLPRPVHVPAASSEGAADHVSQGPPTTATATAKQPGHPKRSARDPTRRLTVTSGQSRTRVTLDKASPVFAIDISASTSMDGILAQEKKAISTLTESLPNRMKHSLDIVPWNNSVLKLQPLHLLEELKSRGGTDPSELTRNTWSVRVLHDCGWWFLLTDGKIDQLLIQAFAHGLVTQRLHAKPCVVMLFGRRPQYPDMCNISVGLAVFALAPDCAFLFHDIDTEEVFILQCKGCFRELLPDKDMQLALDPGTRWHNLPRTSYAALSRLSVHTYQNVSSSTFMLKHGQQVDFDDFYEDRLPATQVSAILHDDDNLKSILLTAQSMGRSNDIEDWISKQRPSRTQALSSDRSDVGGRASRLVKKLIAAQRAPIRDAKMEQSLKKRLRLAHLGNWTNFVNSVKFGDEQSARQHVVIDDALARVRLGRESPGSPALMSPVSPTGIMTAHADEVLPSYYRYTPAPSPFVSQAHDLLYMKGYDPSGGFVDQCDLCEDRIRTLALLLKAKPEEFDTEGFPAPGSRESILWPLAMGNFSETDIISSFLCCEACAFFVRKHGLSPIDDQIVGAIPLVSAVSDANKSLKLKEFDMALQKRFDHNALAQIYLAVLYRKLDDVVGEGPHRMSKLIKALRWECRSFGLQVSLPANFRTPDDTSQGETTASFPTTIRAAQPLVRNGSCAGLVSYPLDGFVTVIKMTVDLKLFNADEMLLQALLFQRFVFHLAETHTRLIEQDGAEAAAEQLDRILTGEVGGISSGCFRAEPEVLKGTYLLETEDVQFFNRIDDLFGQMSSKCGVAIMFSLKLMKTLAWNEGPEQLFDAVRKLPHHQAFFAAPWTLDEAQCRACLQTDRHVVTAIQ